MAKRVALPLLNADSHCASCVPAGVWGRVGEVVVRWRRERKWRPNFISKRARIKGITETTKAKSLDHSAI